MISLIDISSYFLHLYLLASSCLILAIYQFTKLVSTLVSARASLLHWIKLRFFRLSPLNRWQCMGLLGSLATNKAYRHWLNSWRTCFSLDMEVLGDKFASVLIDFFSREQWFKLCWQIAVEFFMTVLGGSILQEFFLALQAWLPSVLILIVSLLFFLFQVPRMDRNSGSLCDDIPSQTQIVCLFLLMEGRYIIGALIQFYCFWLQATHRASFPLCIIAGYYYIGSKMESISRKNHSFRVSIRREQIDNLLKSKRKEILDCRQLQEENNANYWNLLNYTTLDNLTQMDSETLQNHLQMLNEIVSLSDIAPYYQRLEPLLCTVIEFFQYSYNEWFKNLQLRQWTNNPAELEEVLPLLVMNKMLSFVNPNSLTKLIGSIYYEIVPCNLAIVKKTVILMRQMLAFSMKDTCVVSDFLRKAGQENTIPVQAGINRNYILLVLMNITSAEDNAVLDIVYEENIIQNISEWIEVYGFNEQEKQSVCGIYANMIGYLCNSLPLQTVQSIQQEHCQEYNLFLPIYEDLVKLESPFIVEKIVYVSVQLIDNAVQNDLECKDFLIELCEQMMRSIVEKKQYCEGMEDLFIAFVKYGRITGHIAWLLEFLRIALNNYTYAYYGLKQKEKNKHSSKAAGSCNSKCLRNLSKLINTCRSILKEEQLVSQAQTQLECQQQIVRQMVDFWCKEELQPLQQEFLSFMSSCLEADEQLCRFCLENQQICEVLVSLINCSYHYGNEIELAMRLTSSFLFGLQKMTPTELSRAMEGHQARLKEVRCRLQDYLVMLNDESTLSAAEANLSQLNQLFPQEHGL